MADTDYWTPDDLADLTYSPALGELQGGEPISAHEAEKIINQRLATLGGANLGGANGQYVERFSNAGLIYLQGAASVIADSLPEDMRNSVVVQMMDLRPFIARLASDPERKFEFVDPDYGSAGARDLDYESTAAEVKAKVENVVTVNASGTGDQAVGVFDYDDTEVGISPVQAATAGILDEQGEVVEPTTPTTETPPVTSGNTEFAVDPDTGEVAASPAANPNGVFQSSDPLANPEESTANEDDFRFRAQMGDASWAGDLINEETKGMPTAVDINAGSAPVRGIPREDTNGKRVTYTQARGLPWKMDEEELGRLQDEMVASGYLEPGTFTRGFVGDQAFLEAHAALVNEAWLSKQPVWSITKRRKEALNPPAPRQIGFTEMRQAADALAMDNLGRPLTLDEFRQVRSLLEGMRERRTTEAEQHPMAGQEPWRDEQRSAFGFNEDDLESAVSNSADTREASRRAGFGNYQALMKSMGIEPAYMTKEGQHGAQARSTEES